MLRLLPTPTHLILAVTLAISACAHRDVEPSESTSAQGPPSVLRGGAPSVDALLDRFVDAISRNDQEALHGLRVDRDEYTRIIIPGTVEKGKPPNKTFEKTNGYFWGQLNTKSIYYGQVLLRDFGGRTYVARDYEFTSTPREYAWYKASGQLVMHLTDDAGGTHDLRSGWIVEVDGQYKFMGFEWDS